VYSLTFILVPGMVNYGLLSVAAAGIVNVAIVSLAGIFWNAYMSYRANSEQAPELKPEGEADGPGPDGRVEALPAIDPREWEVRPSSIAEEDDLVPLDYYDSVFLRDLRLNGEVAGNLLETIKSLLYSGKRLVIALDRNIKDTRALQVFRELERIKGKVGRDSVLGRKLNNLVIIPEVGSSDELMRALAERDISLDEADGNPRSGIDEKNLVVIFSSLSEEDAESERYRYGDMEKLDNVFCSYIRGSGMEGKYLYYPLPEVVVITLLDVLDHMFGAPRHIPDGHISGALEMHDGKLVLADINIDSIAKNGIGRLVFTLLPKASPYDMDGSRNRYARIIEFLKAA
jgi:hypothetical protein